MNTTVRRTVRVLPYLLLASLCLSITSGCGGGGGGGGSTQPPPPPPPPPQSAFGFFWWFLTGGAFQGTEVDAPGHLLRFTADQTSATFLRDGDRLFVSDAINDSVIVVDATTRNIVNEIAVGRRPISLVPAPNGLRVYAINRDSRTVSVIDANTETVVDDITLGLEPYHAAISNDGTRLLITHRFDRAVTIIDLSAGAVLATPTVGSVPVAVAIARDDSKAYVANQAAGTISVIDLSTNAVGATPIAVGQDPSAILMNFAGDLAFVANRGSDSVSIVDVATDTVSGNPIAVGPGPNALALTFDDSVLFTANAYTPATDQFGCAPDQNNQPSYGNTLTAIDALGQTVVNPSITVAEAPIGLAVLSDNSLAYSISFCAAELSEIGVSGLSVNTIAMPDRSTAVAMGPDDDEIFVVHPDRISFVDTSTRAVTTIVSRGTGAYKLDLRDGGSQVVASRPGDDSITILERATGTLVSEVNGLSRPTDIASSPATGLTIVTNTGVPLATDATLTVIDQAGLAFNLDVPLGPLDVSVSDGAGIAVTANFGDLVPVKPSEPNRPGFGNTITEIELADPTTNPPPSTIVGFAETAGTLSTGIVDAGGDFYIVAANYVDSEITVVNTQTNQQVRIGNLARGPVVVGGDPLLPFALVLTQGDPEEFFNAPTAGTLQIIDPVTVTSICTTPACRSVQVGTLPAAVEVARGIGGIPNRVLVSNYADDTVSIFDLPELLADPALAEQNRIDLAVPAGPVAIAVAEDGGTAWIGHYDDRSVTEIQLPADNASIAIGASVALGAPITDLRYDVASQEVWASSIFANQLAVIQNGVLQRTVDLPD